MTYIPNTRSRWNESPYNKRGQNKELNAYYEEYERIKAMVDREFLEQVGKTE